MDFHPWTERNGAPLSFIASCHSTVTPKATKNSPGFSASIGLWGYGFIFGNTIWLFLEMQYLFGNAMIDIWMLVFVEQFYIYVCTQLL